MSSTPALHSPAADRRPTIMLAGSLILCATWAAYYNSFSAPLLFDDLGVIMGNPTIRHLWPLGPVLSPPGNVGSGGRPLINLTYALNYAWGGMSVTGYHVLNLLLHSLAGLTLFGLVRRTLAQPAVRKQFESGRLLLALAIALGWTLHPLLTASVTYISQRAEVIMGLFYLLTLYGFIRAATSPTPVRWQMLTVIACGLGMASKEVMVTAPVLVLLYDRTFVAGTFREAWKRHGRMYLGLAATWLVLAGLMLKTHQQERGVGYSGAFTGWTYALTECQVVVRYLRLALWPHPLVFDYGTEIKVTHLGQVLPQAMLLVSLLAAVGVALVRWPTIGFLGSWYFLVLAPSSSVVPIMTQPMAENRMYLPLAAVIGLIGVGVYEWAGRKGVVVLLGASLVGGWATMRRNEDYRSWLAIWGDTVAKCPTNSRAHDVFGSILSKIPGRMPEAIAHYEEALRLNPNFANVHNNLGIALSKTGHPAEAMAHYEAALRLKPDFAPAHFNLANALANLPDRLPEAFPHYAEAVRLKPEMAEAHGEWGNALVKIPERAPEAILHYEEALRLKPDSAEFHYYLGVALLKIPSRAAEAVMQFEAALRLRPDLEPARQMLIQLGAQRGK